MTGCVKHDKNSNVFCGKYQERPCEYDGGVGHASVSSLRGRIHVEWFEREWEDGGMSWSGLLRGSLRAFQWTRGDLARIVCAFLESKRPRIPPRSRVSPSCTGHFLECKRDATSSACSE